jgi:hypothetical protein
VSQRTGQKILALLLFGVLGLPPGLCSAWVTPVIYSLLHDSSREAWLHLLVFGVPAAIGFVMFGVTLWWLIRTWRRAS